MATTTNSKKGTDEGKFNIGLTNTQEQRLLTVLHELGGSATQDDSILQQGTKLILPEDMSHSEAIDFLKRHDKLQNETTEFTHQFKFRMWDGAVALHNVLRRAFGTAGLPVTTWSFFGPNRPQMVSVAIGPHDKVQVPWGTIEFPILSAEIHTGGWRHNELGPLFQLIIEAPKKHSAEIAGLFRAIEAELEENSIYRGKAFDGQQEPEFIDLETIDPASAIYSQTVEAQLEANVWSLLDYTDLQRDLNVPLKRAVLLEGPYGSGKTLAAFVTAIKAVANEWTFIYARPGRDDLTDVMATARLYQPSVVFYEDVDTIASSSDDDPLTGLLDLFDGIQAKGTEIMVIMTTNHKERIHKAMARPGRLDSIIEIGAQDASGVRRMIHATVPLGLLDDDLDYEAIAKAMDEFMPAFVKEAIDRATRYGIVRAGGKPERLTTDDFVNAAMGLRPQLELQMSLSEGERPDAIGTGFRRAMEEVIVGKTLTTVDDNKPLLTITNGGKER